MVAQRPGSSMQGGLVFIALIGIDGSVVAAVWVIRGGYLEAGRERQDTALVRIDRISSYVVSQFLNKTSLKIAWKPLKYLLKAVLKRNHAILAENCINLADQPGIEVQPIICRSASKR
ncbi:hypothetical protein [Pseudotabrizicola sp. L79]|uniref:hypothetical protein n=1 Tax=Pseudotabrizicola sp. L79 TaxID=3118402 RepID=UPI002F92C4C7